MRSVSQPQRQSGQALVLGALSLTALMGVLALGIDFGQARMEHTRLQTVADAAALAGAAELPYGDVATGATRGAALNGFTTGSNNDTLAINNPPLSGPHSGDASYVEAVATHVGATTFLKLFNIASLAPTARAVAHLGNGRGCIYALNPSASGAVRANGSFLVNLNCALYVNSDSSQAIRANGSGSITATAIGVAGSVATTGGVTLSPAPVDGMVPVSDPFEDLTPPSTTGSCASPTAINGPGNFTLSAGVYCSPLVISGSSTVTFGSGTYVLQHGLVVNGSPTLIGSEVTFYNAAGSFSLGGTVNTNLSAPTTGPYAGILVYQSPTDTSTLTLNGTNGAVFNGAVYAKSAGIVDNGTSNVSGYNILVGDTITLNGNPSINDNFSSLPGGSPAKAAVLVE